MEIYNKKQNKKKKKKKKLFLIFNIITKLNVELYNKTESG